MLLCFWKTKFRAQDSVSSKRRKSGNNRKGLYLKRRSFSQNQSCSNIGTTGICELSYSWRIRPGSRNLSASVLGNFLRMSPSLLDKEEVCFIQCFYLKEKLDWGLYCFPVTKKSYFYVYVIHFTISPKAYFERNVIVVAEFQEYQMYAKRS